MFARVNGVSTASQSNPAPRSVILEPEAHHVTEPEHSDSRHRQAETGEMPPMGYGIRRELFAEELIALAVFHPDGLTTTLNRIRNAFYAQWGVEARTLEAREAAAVQALEPLEWEHSRISLLLKEIPLTRVVDCPTMPSGPALWGWCGLVMTLLLLSLLSVVNAAAYLRFQTQNWFLAVLMAAPLLFVAIPVKFIGKGLSVQAKRCMGWALILLGTAALSTFIYTLAVRANPPSTADLLDGVVSPATSLIPWQLASQIVLECVVATALWHWLLELMATKSRMVSNPDAELLANRLACLQAAMAPLQVQLSTCRGELQEMDGSLAHWLHVAQLTFQARSERHHRLEAGLAAVSSLPKL